MPAARWAGQDAGSVPEHRLRAEALYHDLVAQAGKVGRSTRVTSSQPSAVPYYPSVHSRLRWPGRWRPSGRRGVCLLQGQVVLRLAHQADVQ